MSHIEELRTYLRNHKLVINGTYYNTVTCDTTNEQMALDLLELFQALEHSDFQKVCLEV